VPVNDIDAVARSITTHTAAVMLEPIQGESGVVPFSLKFLRDVRELTNDCGILLVFDEVQTGIGRTGRMFCFEHAAVRPDVLTLGKGIGAGVPLAGYSLRTTYVCSKQAIRAAHSTEIL
jgi:acetylornithine/N-succinyldiaminopimelate aminotransferase